MFNKSGMSKSRKLSLLAMALCSTVAMPAWAGLKVSSPVVISLANPAAKTASGSIGSARNLVGDQYIGCETLAYSTGIATRPPRGSTKCAVSYSPTASSRTTRTRSSVEARLRGR